MSITKLSVNNFRNLSSQYIELHPKLNFVVGDNGSGKSSLLESVFYLGHGKSFRTNKTESIATHHQSNFIVNIRDDKDNKLGVLRNIDTSEVVIKINEVKFKKLSELAKNIAVQIVTPESFKIFFGGPKERRKFLDLGMFHVKHNFSDQWRKFSRILKQRNACIKARSDIELLNYWDQAFCSASESISIIREKYVHDLSIEVSNWLSLLLPALNGKIQINYVRGWSNNKPLAIVLEENRSREKKQGFSLSGAHKFDIKFILNGLPVETELSRGQQKLFLLALTLAQTKLIAKVNQVKPILLIDDIGAELDSNSRHLLAEAISKVDCQVIITAIEKNVLKEIFSVNNDFSMFHVEHGKISAMIE